MTTKNKKRSGLFPPYMLSPELVDIVGVPVATRVQLNKLLWNYIKRNKLQVGKDRRYFMADDKMRKVFGYGSHKGFEMGKYLHFHLKPVPKKKEEEVEKVMQQQQRPLPAEDDGFEQIDLGNMLGNPELGSKVA